MLKVNGLHVSYGGIRALNGVSLEVPSGTVVTLLGANGAGKTTTLRIVAGLLKPQGGNSFFQGERIDGLAPEEIVKRGVSLVPEGRDIFPEMTVLENLEMGAFVRRDKEGIKQDMERVFDYFPVLKERHKQLAGTLSGGEQQMLAIGRGLMSRPKLLMLDEPSLGLAPLIVAEIFRIIREINRLKTTILLVEQNAALALCVSHFTYVLENGRITMADRSDRLMRNPEVIRYYLGDRKYRGAELPH